MAGWGALIELGTGFNPILTGRENIYNNAAVLGFSKAETDEKLESIIEFSEIGDFIDMPVQNYSSGMKVRLGFAVASHMNPDVLIVDEVLSVGDVGFRMKCYERIFSYLENGGTVILVTHSMLDVGRVASKLAVMNGGENMLLTPEISEGVMLYEKLSQSKSNAVSKSDSKPSFLEIKDVKIHSLRGKGFRTFDTVPIDILISSKSSSSFECKLIIKIESLSLGLIGGFSSSFSGKYFIISPGDNSISLKINRIPLLQGRYFVNVMVFGRKNTEFYGRFMRCGEFTVVEPKVCMMGNGVNHTIYFEHDWT
jgi:lipopolysaccharide transport system ATP-binding protein